MFIDGFGCYELIVSISLFQDCLELFYSLTFAPKFLFEFLHFSYILLHSWKSGLWRNVSFWEFKQSFGIMTEKLLGLEHHSECGLQGFKELNRLVICGNTRRVSMPHGTDGLYMFWSIFVIRCHYVGSFSQTQNVGSPEHSVTCSFGALHSFLKSKPFFQFLLICL